MAQESTRKSYVMFQNAGVADLFALFFVGFTDKNGKPNKIGMFGSGFKLAVTAALRQGIDIIVYLDRDKITFRTVERVVQGEKVLQLYFIREMPDGKTEELPTNLTLGYGSKDWKKPWVVFREVLQNCRDADPRFEVVAGVAPNPREGTTRVFVEATAGIAAIYRNLDTYYREPQNALFSCDEGRVYPKCSPEGSTNFYCRGMYVLTTPITGMYDYDLYDLPINESRDASTGNLNPHLMHLLDVCPMEVKMEVLRFAILEGEKGRRTLEGDLCWCQSGRGFMWAKAFSRVFPDTVLCGFTNHEYDTMSRCGRRAVRVPFELYRLLSDHGVKTAEQILREEAEKERSEFAPEGDLKLNFDTAFSALAKKLPEVHRLNISFVRPAPGERVLQPIAVGRARGEYQFTETLLQSGPRAIMKALVDAMAQTRSVSGRCSLEYESYMLDIFIEALDPLSNQSR